MEAIMRGNGKSMVLAQEHLKLAIILTQRIDHLDLSVQSYNALRRWGVDTIGCLLDLCITGKIERVRGIGKKHMSEIEHNIDEYFAKCGLEVRWRGNES